MGTRRYCVEYTGSSSSSMPGQGGHPETKWRGFDSEKEAASFADLHGGDIYSMAFVMHVPKRPQKNTVGFLDPNTFEFKSTRS